MISKVCKRLAAGGLSDCRCIEARGAGDVYPAPAPLDTASRQGAPLPAGVAVMAKPLGRRDHQVPY